MRDALVFTGASNLDFQDIRSNVIRIPEVVNRVREAQEILDKLPGPALDLANFIASEDDIFLSHIKLKSFATAVVQVGLLDRFSRFHKMPEFIVGAVNGDSPMKVAAGLMTFGEMVSQSSSFGKSVAGTSMRVIQGGELPVLTGIQLIDYAVYRRADSDFERLNTESKDVEKMLIELVDQFDVRQITLIGPGNSVLGRGVDLMARDVQILESIDLDPMLSWFWSNLRGNRVAAVAN